LCAAAPTPGVFAKVSGAGYGRGMMDYLVTPTGRRLAFHRTPGHVPGIVFLGGFKSDMTGTKATALEGWAHAQGHAFLRFDYSGHGSSSGVFEDGCIGEWRADAAAMLMMTEGPQVLVGSSMGGWISLLLARDMADRVAGLVTIAAAPDFTEDIWAEASEPERATLLRDGRVAQPSDYGTGPYVITRRLIEDGRANLIFDRPLLLAMPVRFLQGTADTDVPVRTAMRLMDHAEGPDIRLTLLKGADHRFSTPDCLRLIETSVAKVLARVG
jgi:pimeloyl-ACP methyl ester carboxylesterase